MNFKHFTSTVARNLLCATIISASVGIASAADRNPVANPAAVITSGNARFTVLTPEMIRIEYSDKGAFEDNATFTIVNRDLPVPEFTANDEGDYLTIATDRLNLRYRKGSPISSSADTADNLTITLADGTTWHPGQVDPLNLKGTTRTLDNCIGDSRRADLEDGLISRSGWAVINDSWTSKRVDGGQPYALKHDDTVGFDWLAERADPQGLDLYFLGYGKDYKKALSDYTKIAGSIPLPPDYVFGYWYSKYSVYSADDYRQIMADIKANNIPADVMILDMDWHWNASNGVSDGRGGWTGWSWNYNLLPDPKGLLQEIHDNNFKASLNLHPADGINKTESPEFFETMTEQLGGKYLDESKENIQWSIDYPDFTKSFFSTIIADHEKTGVDFWWIDWQQHLTSHLTEGLSETFWCNHVFFNEMEKNRTDRRPVIFHRWGGLGSHRYQIGFSGDAFITFPTLAFQPYFTATASNVGYGYWGHDLGGHMYSDEQEPNDPELVLRWIQFGAFTPIFRTHATNDSRIERRVWTFPNFPQIADAIRLRYSMFPYIYTMARKSFDTGISICRPLYYEYPDAEEAYTFEGEYFFGDDILVAPITEPAVDGVCKKEIWFPAGKWWSVATNEVVEGPKTVTMDFTAEQIPYFFREGAIIPYNPPTVMNVTERPDHLILNVVAGADGEGSLYEDSGDNVDYATVYATTLFSQRSRGHQTDITINPRVGTYEGITPARSYTLRIYNTAAPKQVKINGKKVKDFSYDAASRCTIVEVPSAPCSDKTEIELTSK